MAIVTPQFLISSVTYNLPQASSFEVRFAFTSVPIKMANGYTKWQAFAIEGDEDPDIHHHISCSWLKMTNAELITLTSAWKKLREGSRGTFRTPDEGSFWVTVDPDQPDLETQRFRAMVGGVATIYYRTTIHLVDDSA